MPSSLRRPALGVVGVERGGDEEREGVCRGLKLRESRPKIEKLDPRELELRLGTPQFISEFVGPPTRLGIAEYCQATHRPAIVVADAEIVGEHAVGEIVVDPRLNLDVNQHPGRFPILAMEFHQSVGLAVATQGAFRELAQLLV